jgi:hypothetical protein
MGDLNRYRKIVKETLTSYTGGRYANGEIDNEIVFDEKNDRFLVMSVGWCFRPPGRVHDCLVHIDIVDGKLWVQGDKADVGLVRELEEAGVAKSDIVLGFRDPEHRKYTDYAVA